MSGRAFCRFAGCSLLLATAFLFVSSDWGLAADAAKDKPKEASLAPRPVAENQDLTIVSAVIDTMQKHGVTLGHDANGMLMHKNTFGSPIIEVKIRSHRGVAGLGFASRWFDGSGKDITEKKRDPLPGRTGFIDPWFDSMTTSLEDEITFEFILPENHKIDTMKCSITRLYFRDKGWTDLKVPIAFEAKKRQSQNKQGVKP